MNTTKKEAPILNHISMDWGPREAFDFCFLAFFPFLLDLFSCFSSGGCVLSRCWWMAANGSEWKIGWFRTVLNWSPSFMLVTINTSLDNQDSENSIRYRKTKNKAMDLNHLHQFLPRFAIHFKLSYRSRLLFSLQIWKDLREGREIVCFQFLLSASKFFLLVKQDLHFQNVVLNEFLSKISTSNKI